MWVGETRVGSGERGGFEGSLVDHVENFGSDFVTVHFITNFIKQIVFDSNNEVITIPYCLVCAATIGDHNFNFSRCQPSNH